MPSCHAQELEIEVEEWMKMNEVKENKEERSLHKRFFIFYDQCVIGSSRMKIEKILLLMHFNFYAIKFE